MKPKKNFIIYYVSFIICLACFVAFNLSFFVSAENTEPIVTSDTTETISNFDIKNLSKYIDSKDYVVCYVYKGTEKGNYIIYPYSDLYSGGSNNFNPIYPQNPYYLYDPKNNTIHKQSISFGGYDWRHWDSYIIGSTYDIKNKNTGEIVFYKTKSNDNIMSKDITSGTIYNNFFVGFKPVLKIVLVVIIVIIAFYKAWGWLRETIQGI